MSKESNQSRMDQYGVISPSLPKPSVRKPKTTSPKAGRDPVQPHNRGPQAQS
jgi:hypothetical protein